MARLTDRKDLSTIVAALRAAGVDCDSLSVVTATGAVVLHRAGEDVGCTESVLQAAIDAAPTGTEPEQPLGEDEVRGVRALLAERGPRR